MKRLSATLILFAGLLATTMMTANNNASVEWKTIAQAFDEAPKTEKKVLLDVYTDWCGWCKRMDRDTYADSAVAAYLKEHYVSSKMNPEKEGSLEFDGKKFSQREFGAALGISGYPATAFFNEKNELLTVIPGYIKAKDFLVILKYFGEDHYKTVKWEDFQKANS